jgi:hypothetical protein
MKVVFFLVLLAIPVLLMALTYHYIHAEELKVLESQLNKNSITGILQNPYNHTVGSIFVRAEFYDKEDGHLVGLRDFYDVSKDQLDPNEKTTFKIYEHAGETQEFPKTGFIVKAEGSDYTRMIEVSGDEMIKGIEDIGKALESLPSAVDINVIEHKNGTNEIAGKTITYENGTKVIVNKTGTFKNSSEQ